MKKNNLNTGNILHIAFGVENIKKVSERISEVFETEVPQINCPKESNEKYPIYYRGEKTSTNYKSCKLKIGNMEIELLEPIGRPNSVNEFLRNNGNGVHHLLIKTDDLNSKIEIFKKKGLELIEYGSFPGGKYAFLYFPEIGTSIELCELDK